MTSLQKIYTTDITLIQIFHGWIQSGLYLSGNYFTFFRWNYTENYRNKKCYNTLKKEGGESLHVQAIIKFLNKSQKAEEKRNGIDGLKMICSKFTTAVDWMCKRRLKLDELNNLC